MLLLLLLLLLLFAWLNLISSPEKRVLLLSLVVSCLLEYAGVSTHTTTRIVSLVVVLVTERLTSTTRDFLPLLAPRDATWYLSTGIELLLLLSPNQRNTQKAILYEEKRRMGVPSSQSIMSEIIDTYRSNSLVCSQLRKVVVAPPFFCRVLCWVWHYCGP